MDKMPKMNGFELYREIRKIDDEVDVCFVIAFEVYYEERKNRIQPSLISKHKEEDVKCLIPKPLTIDDVVKKVKEELNSRSY